MMEHAKDAKGAKEAKPEGPPSSPPETPRAAQPLSEDERQRIHDDVVAALHHVYDPEIPVNIYEVGLVYGVEVAPDGVVGVRMTLTAPNCPAAQVLPMEVEYAARSVPGVKDAKVAIVWDPPWSIAKMSEAARLALGIL